MYHVRDDHGPVLGRTELEDRFPELNTHRWEELEGRGEVATRSSKVLKSNLARGAPKIEKCVQICIHFEVGG